MATELDPQQGRTHSPRMPATFDTLAASEALQAVGVESGQARAIANQLRLAAGAGQGVTHPELEAALAKLETKLLDRIAESERGLIERIAESERRTTAQLWRLFGGIVAVAGVVVALIKYLP